MWTRIRVGKEPLTAVTITLLACLLLSAAGSGTSALAQGPVQPRAPAEPETLAGPVLISYQGLLLDPVTGNPKPSGTYQMVFALYDAEVGGTNLWSETKSVIVDSKGLFNVMLGELVAFPSIVFDGRTLWMGVAVQGDAEATPRQKLGYSAGAIYARNSDQLDGQHSTGFAAASHAHSGADITTGIVAQAYIDAAIARDNEIMSTVLANDGTGSTLDADLLDGFHYTAFARSTHAHSGADITTGIVAEPRIDAALARDTEVMPLVQAGDGAGSGLDADLLDGQQGSFYQSAANIIAGTLDYARYSAYGDLATDSRIGTGSGQVAAGDHLHNSVYVNVTGDTMTGNLTVPGITYSPARTQYYSVSAEDFHPNTNVNYANSWGEAYIYSTISGPMSAPVHLPHGAVVNQIVIYFYDNSASNLLVEMYQKTLSGGAGQYTTLATFTTAGTPGASSATLTLNAAISNISYGYLIGVYCNPWPANNTLTIRGLSIRYTISEAH